MFSFELPTIYLSTALQSASPRPAGAHPPGRPRLHRTPIGEGDFIEVPLAQLIGFIPLKKLIAEIL